MIDLNNEEAIKKLDPKDVYGSTGMFAQQCTQIWEQSQQVEFPQEYKEIKNVVISGMGGSSYGGHVLVTLFKEEMPIPVYVNNDYTLPGFVDEHTLVVLTSYSGSTEETLISGQEAKKRGAKVTGVTKGGKLGAFLKENNYPALLFNPTHNPSGQPRLGTGYIVLGTIALFTRLGMLTSIEEAVQTAVVNDLQQNHVTIKQKAMDIAKQLYATMPVIFAAEFLGGNAHIMRNQFNETSKSFSAFSELPELNHHLMEGLKNPTDKKITILILSSQLYTENLKKRTALTIDVVKKNNVPYIEYLAIGSNKISQVLSTLSFGGYLTLYLALLYEQDPSVIPWVDYFKEQLSKS